MSKTLYTKNTLTGNIHHPGEYIKDELQSSKLNQKQLAEKMGIKPTVMSELVNGKRNITAAIAIKLEESLGLTAEMWMKLQAHYEIMTIKARIKADIEKTDLPLKKKQEFIVSIV